MTREDVFLKQWLYCPQNYWYVDIHERHQNSCIKSMEIYFRMSRKKNQLEPIFLVVSLNKNHPEPWVNGPI